MGDFMTVYYNKISNYTKPIDDFSSDSGSQAESQVDSFASSYLPSHYNSFFKRGFDCFAVLLFAPFVLLIVGVLSLLIAFEGGKPFYHQLRVGRGGRHFKMWKLRTMVHDADERLGAYLTQNAGAKAEWDSTQKLKSDPRITRFGCMLRRSSLDELPQLWNVLKGDMSLVGPRPMMPDQQKLYPGLAYYQLRPGITGLWQVSDRNSSTFAERARFDAAYVRKLSFTTDLRLLMATIRVVMRGTGY